MPPAHHRVAITGLGCITPIGNTPAAFAEALYAGRSGIAAFTPEQADSPTPETGLKFRTWGRVRDLRPADHLPAGVLTLTALVAQFGVLAARQAAAESRLAQVYDPAQIAVLTGCSCGGRDADEQGCRLVYERNARVPPNVILRTMPSSAASSIAIDLGLGGPALNLATACASGTHAIGLAFQMVRSGMAPAALAGGSEAPLTFGFLRAWDSMRVVTPTTCRPFAADRDGMVLAEGAAMLALEPLEAAQARGATIYAEIVGFGMSSDAHHLAQPKAEGAAAAIRRALADAATTLDQTPSDTTPRVPHSSQPHRDEWGPRNQGAPGLDFETWAHRIGYINAHGTGTQANDAAEAAALHQVFGPLTATIPISSTKPLHGHSIGAAGAIEALVTALALHRRQLPYTPNSADPTLNLDLICNEPRALDPAKDLALSNSLAFGGLNAVLAFRAT